jgi:hypothetical protein
MDEMQIKLAALWIAVMFTYLLGDVLRIYSGDFTPGEWGGKPMSKTLWLAAAILMVIPIIMIVLSVTLNHGVNRWANIVVAIFYFGLNLLGLPTYPSAYDRFLIAVSLVFNALTVWAAWQWA